ncbi:HAMP domain-containing sensor histidine kinase [Xylanimonas sp. McL0601]|uniref:HAMP domain-containing sensor histidine kinase n=1 Tax=Xylanimonas sp. McL0601 TaxID=3414739 RepID=UPI003CED8614
MSVIPIDLHGEDGLTDEPTEKPAVGRTRVVRRVSGWFDRQPLRARLVATIAVLLAAGLLATGLATQAIVSRYLVLQVDEQLARTAGNPDALQQTIFSANTGPSDYYVLVRTGSGEQSTSWSPTIGLDGRPVIPRLSAADAKVREGTPFTVKSTGGTHATQWRVVAVRVSAINLGSGLPPEPGIAFVALPLSDVHEASRFLALTLFGVGVGIIALGAVAAWLLVHRSLRPLREIETTAAAIAAGDFARRVPAAPPTTEVGSLGASLNAMLAQIEHAFAVREESERRMRRFVSDASHELRTPLATIRGYGELYRMGALDSDDQVDDTMVRIEDAARRMGTLVNDLLELARMDEGRELRSDPVDLVPMAADAAQDLRALDPSRAVSVVGLDGQAPPSGLVVTGDGDRLRQVLTNLVGNVARHTPAGTPAELAIGTMAGAAMPGAEGRGGGTAVLEVRDHGPGVTPRQAARMFERFYRADSSRNRESGGSGLGLAIVAAIVGAHGGHVETAPMAGGGLVVRVQLPLARTTAPVGTGFTL